MNTLFHARWFVWSLALLLAGLLTACSGGGSSLSDCRTAALSCDEGFTCTQQPNTTWACQPDDPPGSARYNEGRWNEARWQ